ncbi:MAG: DEAD/DEAH box helicase [Calditrichia bacterium]
MNLEQLIIYLREQNDFMQHVTHWETVPEKAAQFANFPDSIDPRLRDALAQKGIRQLYSHQAETFSHIQNGKNVVLVTPTASGKTLGYNLPVINRILQDPDARALYFFPTKALAQDQYHELHDLRPLPARTSKFTHLTAIRRFPRDSTIRRSGHVVMTNPDMLHQGILPHHTIWLKLFENLKYGYRRNPLLSRGFRQPFGK